jgi:hypothetical protein
MLRLVCLPAVVLMLVMAAAPAVGQPKRGLARLEGRWVSASTSPNVDDWVRTFGARGRYTEHTPGGGDVDGRYALVSARGDTMTIRMTFRLGRMTLSTRFRVDFSPDGESITMTSENNPNEPRVFRRAPETPATVAP